MDPSVTDAPGADDAASPILRLRPGSVEWREIDGEIVALEVDSSTYVAANRSGARLWGRLADGATAEELVDELMRHWPISAEQARADVAGFLLSLDGRGLLAT